MLKEFTRKKTQEAEHLLKRLEKINKFNEKYKEIPSREAAILSKDMYESAASIQSITPKNNDDLIQSEIKRRLHGEAAYLEQRLSDKRYQFDTVLSILGIPPEDITCLRPWLNANKDQTLDAIERLYHARDIEGHELEIPMDIPSIKRQAEEFAGAHIQRYHKVIGKFLESLTRVGSYLREMNAVPSTVERSRFQYLQNNLCISIPAICFTTEEGTLHIQDKELIRIYGHEGMGHALNFAVTRSGGLPYFLTHPSYLTLATAESVAQHFESVLIDDLKKSPETQRRLGIRHKFAEIYQEAKDTEQLEDYKRRLFQYCIAVLADKQFGPSDNPNTLERKIETMKEVALHPAYATSIAEKYRYHFDLEGNLDSGVVSELRYCAQPVPRALEIFKRNSFLYEGEHRNLIDTTLLQGLWTPIGFVENARLIADKNKNLVS